MHVLKNPKSLVSIDEQGAQIVAWLDLKKNQQVLWTVNEAYWNRVAPVLFPFVGRLKNDRYTFGGSSYPMKQHGFARDRVFDIIQASDEKLELQLRSDSASLEIYPFNFELGITFSLSESTLLIENTVRNIDKQPLICSFGAHPGFHLEGLISEYAIQIEGMVSAQRHLIQEGLYTGDTETLHFEDGGILNLNEDYFEQDAIVFKHEDIQKMRILKHGDGVLDFETKGIIAPYWGIWKKPGAPFICIEPWWGIADSINATGDLTQKEGMQIIEPLESRRFVYQIKVL